MPRWNWPRILGDEAPATSGKDAEALRRELEATFGDYHASSRLQRELLAGLVEAARREERERVLDLVRETHPVLARVLAGRMGGEEAAP